MKALVGVADAGRANAGSTVAAAAAAADVWSKIKTVFISNQSSSCFHPDTKSQPT